MLLLFFEIDEPLAKSQTVTAECYDISGKRMLLLKEAKGIMDTYDEKTYLQMELDVSCLPPGPGVYIIQVFNNEKRQSGKFVKL